MFASSRGSRSKRRGIVLVLVLGMLGLMALIGVTFATFAGQSLINSRNFQQGVSRPQAEVLMDYALAQLINDTNNPLSAIRGHSLLRDMYGNDSNFRGSNPSANPASETGGLLSQVVYPNGGSALLQLTGYQVHSTSTATPFFNQLQYFTNIPTNGQYYGLDFTRWVVRFPNLPLAPNTVPQSFEVLEDDATGAFHVFTFSNNLSNPTLDPTYPVTTLPITSSDWTSFIYMDPNLGATVTSGTPTSIVKAYSNLAHELNTSGNSAGTLGNGNATTIGSGPYSNAFVLDGRYMRAFNGPGLTRLDSSSTTVYPYNYAAYGNFRLSGLDPDTVGMDEDYDACDLENWYLAIQSADGQIVIPSFHRPGILTADDWTTNKGVGNTKILRPRQTDNSPLFPADPSITDANGKLTYDVDNDGDGITDSVWLDLGYPVQRDPGGKMYKPLFSFMIIGLNGRMPLNTVGNIQARAIGDQATYGANLTYYNGTTTPVTYGSTAQVATPGGYVYNSMTAPGFHPNYSSETYLDAPLWDHTSHTGFSVNEINPKFALQNAPSNVYPSSHPIGTGTAPNANATNYTQLDNAGVNVALTQLRNILAGTKPTDIPYGSTAATYTTNNNDANIVSSDGQSLVFPNNVADPLDLPSSTNVTLNTIFRGTTTVPGRWGEPQGVPSALDAPGTGAFTGLNFPTLFYNNPVRAGRSIYTAGTQYNLSNDILDDDFDATDPYLPSALQIANQFFVKANLGTSSDMATGTFYQLPQALANASTLTEYGFYRNFPEAVDFIDNAGQFGIATERIRRYVTPHDPAGVGRLVSYMNRPNNDHDYGTGSDNRGRMGYFRYFRPAGLPQEVHYPYVNDSTTQFPYGYVNGLGAEYYTGSGTGQRFLMPMFLPAGYSSTSPATSPTMYLPASKSDTRNNRFHGWQSNATPAFNTAATPAIGAQTVASMGAMPRDWDQAIYDPMMMPNATPVGDKTTVSILAPTIAPFTSTVLSHVNSENGPNIGATGNGGVYPIPYGATYSTINQPLSAQVVNGYLGGSLNKDEADEMNLYTKNHFDMPYGPSDLEWLYRKQDVDGSTLTSRLSKLAPVSFNNPADGLTRRRMFSTDTFDTISFSYANDNPFPYAGAAYNASSDHDFTYNSRFASYASPSLEIMNQIPATSFTDSTNQRDPLYHYGNPITTEFLPNPTLPPQSAYGSTINNYVPNSSYVGANAIAWPLLLDTKAMTVPQLFNLATTNAQIDQTTRLIIPAGSLSSVQVQTPSVAHRDRKINLNFPLPVSNDPAEPVRQKWCRETYQLLKAILPPAAVDTPEELAQLSQFVVNIIDFRDVDCSMTRFVNTDLEVTDNLTHTAKNSQQNTDDDKLWTVSVPGVKFATTQLSANHFPYDPSIYNPDGDGDGNPITFLVQHGMEYNPIAINEAMGYAAVYGSQPNAAATYQGLFVELVNTLSEEQNNPGTTTNTSAISLNGWDMVITPDNYGWGRPDPNSGDVNPIAVPPYLLPANVVPALNPTNAANAPDPSQRPFNTMPSPAVTNIQNTVLRYSFGAGATIAALNSTTANSTPTYFVVGDYRVGANSILNSTVEGSTSESPSITPVANATGTGATNGVNLQLPTTFVFPPTTTPSGYYWVYLRRPANPFDVAAPSQVRPNKEMVVVDAMRFPYINASDATVTPNVAPTKPTVTQSVNQVFSAQRLQPYRGGHLVPVDTPPPAMPNLLPADGTTTICPPSPPYAYGYSEQSATPVVTSTSYSQYTYSTTATSGNPPTTTTTVNNIKTAPTFMQSINSATGGNRDSSWSPFPFHDRDFASVAELLLVPGCPPGLFTKQFVEEKYPGNVLNGTTPAAGMDYRVFSTKAVSPPNKADGTTDPTYVGRQNFNAGTGEIPGPTFPYLSDNFYYTAASVTPPPTHGSSSSYNVGYTNLTTEIGGWTGAGWHKMLEFFEVPSSANGAIGTADGGNNYDWARSDTKPGQLNINLIVDEEVFAGLIDDPRLNEALAANSSMIPYVVSQIDATGYPSHDTTSGNIIGRSPIFGQPSTNVIALGTPVTSPVFNNGSPYQNFGRGYVYRDPNYGDYDPTLVATAPPYQQVHGIKAAFSDFLKLRHGGSGYLFGYGAGPTGSGDFVLGPLAIPLASATHPLAAERPYRSLSYPDINYTILRPASLPPSPVDSNTTPRYVPSTPPLPSANDSTPRGSLTGMFQYQSDYSDIFPFAGLNNYLAPMNNASDSSVTGARSFSYIQDPGLKNPYLPIQFVNTTAPLNATAATRLLGPPYAVAYPRSPSLIPSAPFPPPIPPTPARRLFQIPDVDQNAAITYTLTGAKTYSSNASLLGQYDNAQHQAVNAAINQAMPAVPTDDQLAQEYTINHPVITPQLSTLPAENLLAVSASTTVPGPGFSPFSSSSFIYNSSPLPSTATIPINSALIATPPSLVDQSRALFQSDNYLPNPMGIGTTNHFLGAGIDSTVTAGADHRMHPAFRTEWLQKISNLTTVRTHQYAAWITVGFFEVVQTGTPELGVPDAVGQELGLAAGRNVRYRSFFVIDRTKATGFNPFFPGNFRDCVTYRRRIE